MSFPFPNPQPPPPPVTNPVNGIEDELTDQTRRLEDAIRNLGFSLIERTSDVIKLSILSVVQPILNRKALNSLRNTILFVYGGALALVMTNVLLSLSKFNFSGGVNRIVAIVMITTLVIAVISLANSINNSIESLLKIVDFLMNDGSQNDDGGGTSV